MSFLGVCFFRSFLSGVYQSRIRSFVWPFYAAYLTAGPDEFSLPDPNFLNLDSTWRKIRQIRAKLKLDNNHTHPPPPQEYLLWPCPGESSERPLALLLAKRKVNAGGTRLGGWRAISRDLSSCVAELYRGGSAKVLISKESAHRDKSLKSQS